MDADPDVVDRRVAALPKAGAGFDAVPVRVEEKAAVVVGVVLRPQARLAVVAVAGLHPTLPEGVDVLPRLDSEGHVQVTREWSLLLHRRDREVVPLEEFVTYGLTVEHGRVEPARGLEVGDSDGDVVEHA